MRSRALAVLLVAASFAGCMGGDEVPNERRFSAQGGTLTAGWAYGGSEPLAVDASLEGMTEDAGNTGSVTVLFTLDGAAWSATFDRFVQAEGKSFQDGGIEHALDEHGETGVADASIPRIHALVAAWGTASLSRAGELVTQEPWAAHLMVSADSVRGPDGKITKADGVTPYDPATPADARRFEGDPQALMFLKHPLGETFSRGTVAVEATLSCGAPQCTSTAEVPIEEGASTIVLNLTYTPTGPLPLAAGRGRLTIVDATGATVYDGSEVQVVPGPTPTTGVVEVPGDAVQGPLTLQLTGDGAFDLEVEGTVTYVDHPFLVFTWDEVTLG